MKEIIWTDQNSVREAISYAVKDLNIYGLFLRTFIDELVFLQDVDKINQVYQTLSEHPPFEYEEENQRLEKLREFVRSSQGNVNASSQPEGRPQVGGGSTGTSLKTTNPELLDAFEKLRNLGSKS